MNQPAKFRLIPLFTLLFGVIFIGLAVAGVCFIMRVFEERYFDIEAEQISESCFDSFRDAEKSIHAISALFTSASEIDSDAFRIISEQMLSQIPVMKSIRFAQVVHKDDQADFEAKMQKSISGYRIHWDDQESEFFVANLYYEPLTPIALSELGQDILKHQDYKKSILSAIEQGGVATIGPIQNEKENNQTYFFIKAVYSGKTSPQDFNLRKKSALGLIMTELNITQLLNSLHLREGYRVSLIKKTRDDKVEEIFQSEAGARNWWSPHFAYLLKVFTARLAHFSYELSIEKKIQWNFDKIILLLFVLIGGLTTLSLAYTKVKSFVSIQIEVQRQVEEKTQIIEEQRARMANAAKLSSLGEMAGGIAHEINNPLAVVKLLSNQIQKELTQEQGVSSRLLQKVKKIEDMVDRITSIISGLRSFSRDGEKDELRLTAVEKILNDTLSLCQEKIRNGGIELRVDPFPPNLEIECQEVQISQVILNLLGNAYDAVVDLEEKWIQVSVENHFDKVQIAITDSGKGIPNEIQEKIFQPFFTTKEVGKGTGLGLSVSMGIVQKHKGKLSVDRNSSYTRFIVLLPKRQS